ncbi:MAG TPA: PQQ-dependent sugar dehydrogenase [Gammaproteobacteria bacterium]|nr:PQQ-dependent sugar dehydrogenase [Gammaproteobacteria bacterium]
MKTSLAAVALLASSIALAQTPATPNPPQPRPKFAGQTKAPPPKTPSKYRVETITEGLTGPWALAFLPDGSYLVSERRGNLRTVSRDGKVSEPIAGVPPVKVVAAQSFHDVVLDPNFAQNRYIYFTYFAPPKGEAAKEWPIEHYYNDVWNKSLAERRVLNLGEETVARAKLSADNKRLENLDILIQAHVERRIVFGRDGTMFVTGADAFRFYDSDLDSIEGRVFTDNPDVRRNFTGRVIRINSDGTIPKDNPWLGRATVARETYAHGLKDPEGAALNPATGELWITDHGPQGGDEIDIVRPGHDYGWPEVSYGVQYDARQADGRKNVAVGSGKTSEPGVDEPIYFWVPSIAPSGMAFYTGDLFPEWKGNLFVGAMAGQALVRLVLDGERVVAEERLLTDLALRIREVRQGPDGALYVFGGDSLLRISPAK